MIKKIEHIGIAVKSFEESLKPYLGVLGLELHGIEEVEFLGSDYKVGFLPVGETKIELVYTNSKTGLAADFLREKGEGIHHIAFEVDDIEAYYTELVKMGVKTLSEVKPGSRGTKVFYFAPEEFNGVYIEIIEKPA